MSLQLHSAPLPLQLLSVIFWLLTLTARTLGHEHGTGARVFVKEGNDFFLHCSLGTQNIAAALFDWRKVAERDQPLQEVFMYDAGIHYNNGGKGQSDQFRGRVSHFPEELKHGNASIIIRNTKKTDSGNYTCVFPHLETPQTFNVEVVVVAAPKPFVTALDAGETWSLLQCEVRGASPRPKVRWQDSDGNQLPAEEAQVSERGSSYDITLNITVTKTGRYRCVVEQEDIKHRITSETFVHISEKVYEDSSSKVSIEWLAFTFVLGVFIVIAVEALLVFFKRITIHLNNSLRQQETMRKKRLEEETQTKGLENQENGVIYKKVKYSYEVPSEGGDFVGSSPAGLPSGPPAGPLEV
ncbi:V-set and immunoglobulin domain-containing protein 1-like isoform X2 [Clinocottus analis]|uniref:V-set and immunoglobulin domain-containing protein 1-like isoform X2 n=1 Tax=Clinocottus analis TaxID=304258 RepID=UPI0035C0C4A4